MAKYISTELARLIKQRAYAQGALSHLDRLEAKSLADFVQLRQSIQNLRRQKSVLRFELDQLDRELVTKLPVAPEDIRPIRHTPRSGCKHGSIVESIVQILKNTAEPVATPVIVAVLSRRFGWPSKTTDDRNTARRKVTKPLQLLVKKGAVVRIHDASKNRMGSWQWVGL